MSIARIFFLALVLFSTQIIASIAEEIRSVDSIISDIRKEQGLKETDKIDPAKVRRTLLEELGTR